MRTLPSICILHYTLPPVVGGVEAVILAQARAFIQAGYPLSLVGGCGEPGVLPPQSELILIPEIDTRHPENTSMNALLEAGNLPDSFSHAVDRLIYSLQPVLERFDHVIIHNVLTKHFNLPLTAALAYLVEARKIRHAIAWCHDFSWTSTTSREKVHTGHPWDLLRSPLRNTDYVTVSEKRRQELAGLFNLPVEAIHLVYNGVEPRTLWELSDDGVALVERMGLMASDLIVLMPVRITHAKNIEYALQVLAHLKTMCQNPRLIITGPPDPHNLQSMDYFRSLKTLSDQLGVTAEIRFVFESGPKREPYIISERLVGELIRVSDIVFMPSHHEGFGMPVLEAGLVGIPVVSTDIPASTEIGEGDVFIFSTETSPQQLAGQILSLMNDSPTSHFRRRIRQNYTWQALFQKSIEPLLVKESRLA